MDTFHRWRSTWTWLLCVCAVLGIALVGYTHIHDSTIKIDHAGRYAYLIMAADGSALAGGSDSAWEIYRVPEYTSFAQIAVPHFIGDTAVVWSADLSQVAMAAGTGSSIEIRDVRTNAILRSLPSTSPGVIILDEGPTWSHQTAGEAAVMRLAWSADGRFLAIVRYSGAVQVWDLHTDTMTTVTVKGDTRHECLTWSADSQLLTVHQESSDQLFIYRAPAFTEPRTLKSESSCMQAVWHPNGTLLAQHTNWLPSTGSAAIEVWHITTQIRTTTLSVDASVMMTWHPTEEILAFIRRGRIELWRPFDDTTVILNDPAENWITALTFSPDGHTILFSNDAGTVRAWPLAEHAPLLFH